MEGASVQLYGAATGSETSSQGGEWPRMVGFSLAEAAFNDAFFVARATLPTTMMYVSPRDLQPMKRVKMAGIMQQNMYGSQQLEYSPAVLV